MENAYRHYKKYIRLLLIVMLESVLFVGFFLAPIGITSAQAALTIEAAVKSTLGAVADFSLGNVLALLGTVLIEIGEFFMRQTGALLDAAIPFSLTSNNFRLTSIALGWGIFRDLANVVFIFILLYVAIMTILQGQSFNTKRILTALIIVALLVNFSFFITGFVIDVGNILALFIYNIIVECPASMTCDNDAGIRPISEVFAKGTNIASLLDRTSFISISNAVENGLTKFMAGIVYIVLASVFLSGAILFILRTVTLMFVLVLSPIAFAALILPKTRQYWNQWLHKLIGHTFVAPIYLLLIAVVAAIIHSKQLFNTSSAGGSLGDARITDIEGVGVFLSFALIIGFIQGSLILSKRVAGDIAGMSVRWSGKLTGAGIAAGAFALRQTAGRGFSYISERKGLKKAAAKEGVRGFGARMALKSTQYGARANYDARGIAGVQAGIKSTTGGADPGRARGKGGYTETLKKQTEKEVKFAESLGKEHMITYAKTVENRGKWAQVASRRVGHENTAIGKAIRRKHRKGDQVTMDDIEELREEIGGLEPGEEQVV